jgi:hypothetical protein
MHTLLFALTVLLAAPAPATSKAHTSSKFIPIGYT